MVAAADLGFSTNTQPGAASPRGAHVLPLPAEEPRPVPPQRLDKIPSGFSSTAAAPIYLATVVQKVSSKGKACGQRLLICIPDMLFLCYLDGGTSRVLRLWDISAVCHRKLPAAEGGDEFMLTIAGEAGEPPLVWRPQRHAWNSPDEGPWHPVEVINALRCRVTRPPGQSLPVRTVGSVQERNSVGRLGRAQTAPGKKMEAWLANPDWVKDRRDRLSGGSGVLTVRRGPGQPLGMEFSQSARGLRCERIIPGAAADCSGAHRFAGCRLERFNGTAVEDGRHLKELAAGSSGPAVLSFGGWMPPQPDAKVTSADMSPRSSPVEQPLQPPGPPPDRRHSGPLGQDSSVPSPPSPELDAASGPTVRIPLFPPFDPAGDRASAEAVRQACRMEEHDATNDFVFRADTAFWRNLADQAKRAPEARREPLLDVRATCDDTDITVNRVWLRGFVAAWAKANPHLITIDVTPGGENGSFRGTEAFWKECAASLKPIGAPGDWKVSTSSGADPVYCTPEQWEALCDRWDAKVDAARTPEEVAALRGAAAAPGDGAVVVDRDGADIGLHLTPGLVLVSVHPGSPSSRAGAGQYTGKRLRTVGGTPVRSLADVGQASQGRGSVQLVFGSESDGTVRTDPSAPAPQQMPTRPPPGENEVDVSREPGADLGCDLLPSMLLLNVVPDSPAGRAGVDRFVGWRLTHLEGETVDDLGTLKARVALAGRGELRLRFAPVDEQSVRFETLKYSEAASLPQLSVRQLELSQLQPDAYPASPGGAKVLLRRGSAAELGVALATAPGVPGVAIVAVRPNSLADRAGLGQFAPREAQGATHVITHAGGRPVHTPADVVAAAAGGAEQLLLSIAPIAAAATAAPPKAPADTGAPPEDEEAFNQVVGAVTRLVDRQTHTEDLLCRLLGALKEQGGRRGPAAKDRPREQRRRRRGSSGSVWAAAPPGGGAAAPAEFPAEAPLAAMDAMSVGDRSVFRRKQPQQELEPQPAAAPPDSPQVVRRSSPAPRPLLSPPRGERRRQLEAARRAEESPRPPPLPVRSPCGGSPWDRPPPQPQQQQQRGPPFQRIEIDLGSGKLRLTASPVTAAE
eukprot:TRINITY_DN217_c0_g4_i1.p1 TRINITY_DN217_c0_g4~~TRINITY_DN217_c0_g4_i1.p1  ORF type:complete len:1083 (+),score=282.18 TRINITY_DN217_c0_g4_i1:81-3329(+)